MSTRKRLSISGQVRIQAQGHEQAAELADLSMYGAKASGVEGTLKAGEQADLTFSFEGTLINPIRSEVVWQRDGAAGFRFLEPETSTVQADLVTVIKKWLMATR